MRILHTSDWHVGKLLRGRVAARRAPRGARRDRRDRGRASRSTSCSSPATCSRSAAPPPEATAVVCDALLALRDTGARRRRRRRQPRQPVAARRGRAGVRRGSASRCSASRPPARRGGVVDARRRRRAARRAAAVRVAAVGGAGRQLHRARPRRRPRSTTPSACRPLLACARARASRPTRSTSSPRTAWCGAARSAAASATRRLIDDYARRRPPRFPPRANYVALGHLHRAQQHARRRRPIWYCGLADPGRLRRGARHEARARRRHAEAGVPAQVDPVRELTTAWTLRTVRGTLDELAAAADTVGDAWLRVVVRGAAPGRPRRRSPRRCCPGRSTSASTREARRDADGDARPPVRRGRSPRDLFARVPRRRRRRRHTRRPPVRRLLDDAIAKRRLMRPLRSHAEGFGVFRDAVDIDFAGADFFALVGPTGTGKSTVIDAICFALYGSVPRYGDERQVARVVSIGKQEAKVSLTFTVGEQQYRATRVVRIRNGKASTPEALLERHRARRPGDGPRGQRARAEARGRAAARPAVRALHEVRRAPARRVRRFLHDEPAKRRDLLTQAPRLRGLRPHRRAGPPTRPRPRSRRSRSTSVSSPRSPAPPRKPGPRRKSAGVSSSTCTTRSTPPALKTSG